MAMTTIRDQIREIEAYVKTKAATKAGQLKVISTAQSLAASIKDERSIAVLAAVKNRIIRESETQ